MRVLFVVVSVFASISISISVAFGSIIDVVAGPAAFRDHALGDEVVAHTGKACAVSEWGGK